MSEVPSAHNSQQLARYILTSGRRIRERLFRIYSDYLDVHGKNTSYGELSLPQFTALMIVQEHGSLHMNELAECLMVSAPSASAMVDRLVEKKLLAREQSTADRRQVIVSISRDAAPVVAELEALVLQSFAGLVAEIGTATAKEWCRILKRVEAVLQSQYNSDGGFQGIVTF